MLPVGLDVVRSAKELNFPGARRKPLYHAVDLIGFMTGGADLRQCAHLSTSRNPGRDNYG